MFRPPGTAKRSAAALSNTSTPDCACRSMLARPAEVGLERLARCTSPIIFRTLSNSDCGIRCGQESSQSFFEFSPSRERRASNADQTCDLRRFDGRPGFADNAGAGEKLRRSEDRRTIDVIAVQRSTAHGRWNMDPASMSGTRDAHATLQQIRDAKLRSSNALRTNAKKKPGFSAGFRAQSVLFIQSLQCGRPWPPPRGPAIPPPPPGAAM